MSCEHCFKGVRYEGTPEGTYEHIASVKCYVATPSGSYDTSKILIYLSDAFGLELANNRLLCDNFARNGYAVVAPDLLEGDPASAAVLDDPALRATLDYPAWAARHSPAHNLARVRRVVDALRGERGGAARFAAVGCCYGARVVVDLVFAGELDVAAMTHPSLLTAEDFEKYAASARAPLLINACEVDDWFGADMRAAAAALFEGFAHGFRMPYFAGCTHGFAVRGDVVRSDPKVKAGKEGAFAETVRWLQRYL